MEIRNMAKMQKPDKRADNTRWPPLRRNEKIPHMEISLSRSQIKVRTYSVKMNVMINTKEYKLDKIKNTQRLT